MQQELTTAKINYAEVGEAISHELGAKMVKDYSDLNLMQLNCFNIGRNIIDQILGQPGCAGLRLFKALNEQGNETLVYAGIDKDGKTIVEYPAIGTDGKLGVVEAFIGDKTDVAHPFSWF